jgi:tRNA threonylcarbamoyladenosine biosynthesis protein TsaB
MRLLAIDTAFEACSVGVSAGDAAPILMSETIGRGQAERLMGMIESAMAEAGMSFDRLERIGVTVGPGSFTGLRIGIAAARGLALVCRCEIVGIGTLAVHAEKAREMVGAHPVLAALDARRGEIYGQFFAADGGALCEAEIGPVEAFARRCGPDMFLAGSAAEAVAARLGASTARIAHRESAPDIGTLVRLTGRAAKSSAPPRPLYLRPPDAKPQARAALAP